MTKDKKTYNPQDNNIKIQAPTLFGIKKQNPFSVPDGYFDDLPNIILNRINEKKTVSLWNNLHSLVRKPHYSIAASLVILLISVAGYFFLFNKSNAETNIMNPYVELDNIIRDNNINLYNIEESFFIDALLSESDVQTNNMYLLYLNQYVTISDGSSGSYELADISSEDIVDYLSLENYNTAVLYDL